MTIFEKQIDNKKKIYLTVSGSKEPTEHSEGFLIGVST